MAIKSQMHLNSILKLMRDAQKEAARTHRKDFKATARYWEDMVDKYLESADKNDRGPVLQLKEKAAPGPGAA